ncbi:MAG: glycosyltransferase 4 family protein [Candidatus Micrarchaeota archaeon]
MDPYTLEFVAAAFIFAFAATFTTVPFIISNSLKAGIVGRDRNKKGEPVPEMGGVAIVAGITFGILIAIALGLNTRPEIKYLLAALSSVLLMGILGILDDLFNLKRKIKAPIPFIAAIPLSAVRAGTRTIDFPFLNPINFGAFYPLAIVPIGIGGASNAFNMLAGLNGLEAGMGIIISGAVFAAAYMKGSYDAMIISISLLGACLAFYYFNRFPAKIFPGDVGTYSIGATIASAAIIGNLEFFGLVLFLPYFAEFILKARGRFSGQNFGSLKNGKLVPPKRTDSLTHIVMRMGSFTEQQVVNRLLLMELIVAAVALAFFVH